MTRATSALRLNDPRVRYFYRTVGCIPFLVPYWSDEEFALLRHALCRVSAFDATTSRARLRDAFRDRLGVEHVVLTSTGRLAIEIALRALAAPGREVIVPSFACTAVATAVVDAGFVPVFADVADDLTLSLPSVEEKVTKETAAVIVAHLSGAPAQDLDALVAFCRDRGILLIDDAAQALGVRHGGRLLGTFGDAGVFSFGLGKPTFSIGGGALILRDATARARCEEALDAVASPREGYLRQTQQISRFLLRYVYRRRTLPFLLTGGLVRSLVRRRGRHMPRGSMTALEAELQVAQLGKLPAITHRFRTNATAVVARLPPGLTAPQDGPECGYSKCLLAAPGRARALAAHLMKHGIETEWSYWPLDTRGDLARYRRSPNMHAEAVWPDLLAVPVHPSLTPSQVQRIGDALAEFS